MRYTYDPTGNITQIEDRAIPTVFYNNQKITGISEYSYDALYRLIAASGREQSTNAPNFGAQDNWNDAFALFAHNSGDAMAIRPYTQRYQYDGVGNILQMRHEAGANGSWTRDYTYESKNNRLKTTAIGGNTYSYPHHAQHGYMTAMPHLQEMAWTFKEELRATSKQRRTDGGSPETTYYVYDGTGQRVRKLTENQADAGATQGKKDERLYIGAYELYKNENDLKRESLHIMDDKQRIAMLDTETEQRRILVFRAGRTNPVQTVRYQMGNHLGSVSLELDENAAVISYEEYHPYGTTAYQAKNGAIKSAAKRYRYTGMERDEETGLEYHSARYYVPILGRWLSGDPIGIGDGMNVYWYGKNAPTSTIDVSGHQAAEAISSFGQGMAAWGGGATGLLVVDDATLIGIADDPLIIGTGAVLIVGLLIWGGAELFRSPSPRPEAKPESKPKPEAKPESKPKPEAKPESKPKPETKPESKPKPETKPESKPKSEARPDPIPPLPQSPSEKNKRLFVVRLQAQGNGLEKSEVLTDNRPITATEALLRLEVLKRSLTPAQLREREQSFKDAAKFISRAALAGGVDPVRRTFLEPGTKDIRVDVEVLVGRNLTPP